MKAKNYCHKELHLRCHRGPGYIYVFSNATFVLTYFNSCSQIRTLCKKCHVQRERYDKNMKIWGRRFLSLSQKYEERVRKFSFLAWHYFKVELYCCIYILIFGKYLTTSGCINVCLDPQCIVSQGNFQHKILNWSTLLPILVPT